jgi:hypothetical protein
MTTRIGQPPVATPVNVLRPFADRAPVGEAVTPVPVRPDPGLPPAELSPPSFVLGAVEHDGPGTTAPLAAGLARLADAARTPAAGARPLLNVDDANRFAAERLALMLADHGVAQAAVSVKLARSMWTPGDFRNQQQLTRAIDASAAFAARLARDGGAAVQLDVLLTPRGELSKTAGSPADALYVPVNRKFDEVTLRRDWSSGAFIRPDQPWNPLAHIEAGKQRTYWKLALDPVGEVRTRLRGVLGQTAAELTRAIDGTLARGLDEHSLRAAARALVDGHVRGDVVGNGGGRFVDEAFARLDAMDAAGLTTFLQRWRREVNDGAAVEGITSWVSAGAGARIRDHRRTLGLVNVDTFDAVTVAPDGALGRHGAAAIGDVELRGTRVGLVNVSSTDVVTVVPDLARMILGGTTVERALG